MIIYNIAFIILILSSPCLLKLVGVISLFRHGARTPINHFHLVSHLFSPYKNGEVTPNGIKQHYLLGRFLRKRYIENENTSMNILKGNFVTSDIKILSQNFQRTINSAVAHLSGLFKNDIVFSEYQEYLEHSLKSSNALPPIIENDTQFMLRDQFKLINTKFLIINRKNDKLLAPRECFGLQREFDKTVFTVTDYEKEKIISIRTIFPEQIDKIIESNFNVKVMKKLLDLIVNTNYHFKNYYKIPQEVISVFKRFWLKYSYHEVISDENKKLLVSSFFQKVINTFDNLIYTCSPRKKYLQENKNNGKSYKAKKDECIKMLILSGRDTSIVDIFGNILNEDFINNIIENPDFDNNILTPQWASSLIFELHYDKLVGKYFVKILYNAEENLREFRKAFGKTITYAAEKGIIYEDFKALLSSRINNQYKYKICTDDEFDG